MLALLSTQLEWIQFIQQIRAPVLDRFIVLLNFFDTQEFLFFLIPVIWLGFGWLFGMRIFYLLSLSHVVNSALKLAFALPRPFHLNPSLGLIHVSGYGFPSGAAQNAILLSGLLVIYWKNPWRWFVAVMYTLLISFSRLYLGVHFPMDILGGWTIGLLLLGVYWLVFPKIECFFRNRSPTTALLINYLFLIALMLLWPSPTIISFSACAMGLGMGVFINKLTKFSDSAPKSQASFWVRIAVGIVGVFLIYGLAAKYMNLQLFIVFFIIGLWISFIALQISNKILCLKK